MGTLAFERGASTLGQQLGFENELREITDARTQRTAPPPIPSSGSASPTRGSRCAIMRFHALRTLPLHRDAATSRPATSIHKLFWATFHRALGELAVDVLGAAGVARRSRTSSTRCSACSSARADTIYGGSNQIQSNVIGEQALGPAEGTEDDRRPSCRRRPYPDGHGLLAGKTVLVTAAAGTGIGFATAKRCVEEGARVAITDIHERRLGESADRARRARRRSRDVHVAKTTSQRCFDRRRRRARPARRAREQRRPRRHRAARRDDRRAVVVGARRDAHRHDAHDARRAARTCTAARSRRDREQRVGGRLARRRRARRTTPRPRRA